MAAESEIVSQIVALRRVRAALTAPAERRRLSRVIRQLRRQLGAGVPKQQAATAIGVSVQALDRWVAAGKIPTVRRPGSSRELIDTEALLALVAEVEHQQEHGERRALAKAIAALSEEGKLRRRLRPNQTARELRHEFLHSTPAGRLRQGIALSHVSASLAANYRERNEEHGGPNEDTPPDFFGLLRTLCAAGVEFVLIGGFAVTLQGFTRNTKDIDIVPRSGGENDTRLWNALGSLGARPAAAGDLERLLEGGGNWVLYTTLGRIDLMPYVEDTEGELPYEELRESAEEVTIAEVGSPIWVASVEHLIGMKEHAGRDQDQIDVTALRRAHGLEAD